MWDGFRIYPFHVTSLFLYPLRTSQNQRFSNIFREYRKRPVAWNGLRKTTGLQFRGVIIRPSKIYNEAFLAEIVNSWKLIIVKGKEITIIYALLFHGCFPWQRKLRWIFTQTFWWQLLEIFWFAIFKII